MHVSNLMAISSSPRRNGNSELLLNSFVEGARHNGWETELLRLQKLNISPCQACDGCSKKGQCVQDDDMQYVFQRLQQVDGLVVASPIYFGTLSAQLKIFIDRFQCWWQAKYRLKQPFVGLEEGKIGFFICVSALKDKGYCEDATKVAKVLFHNLNYHYVDALHFQGFDRKGSIKEDPEALKSAYVKGQNFSSGQ